MGFLLSIGGMFVGRIKGVVGDPATWPRGRELLRADLVRGTFNMDKQTG